MDSLDWALGTVVGDNMCQSIWVSHRLIVVVNERNTVVQAYILIQTEVGKAAVAAATISEIAGVASSEEVSGPYDVIVRVDATNASHLTEDVVPKIQQVDGITRTLTCPVVTGIPRQV
ncbi:UNVERIFIED_CONTAM: AsnC-like helix-turn-helix protein [Williamsia faeni]